MTVFGRIWCFALLLQGTAPMASAAWRTIFDAGTDDENYADFCQHDGVPNPPPGSALLHDDDDTYLAGTYPPPIGLVPTDETGTSLLGQPTLAVTISLGGRESSRRVHFILPAAEASHTARVRLILDITQLRWIQNGAVQLNGAHDLQVRLNGTVIAQFDGISQQGILSEVFDPPPGLLTAGPNVLEYTRTGGSPNGNITLDRLKLEINGTARRDGDGDGLPESWEEENGLSDQNALDATADTDGDGLSALQEMARRSHPLRSDTDGDGLDDGLEPGLPNGSSPVLPDTDGDTISDKDEGSVAAALSPDVDGDGSPDVWELHQKTLPAVAGDGALLLKETIGLKFNHLSRPGRAMEPFRIGGVVPQMNWNNTRNLVDYDGIRGGSPDIVSPGSGSLVDGQGRPTGLSLAWSGGFTGITGNAGNEAGRLTDAMLRTYEAAPAVITMTGIPWAVYDVYVYLGSMDPRFDTAVRLNGDAASDRWLKIDSRQPIDGFQESGSKVRAQARRGNYVRYRNVTGGNFSVAVLKGTDASAGLSAIQVVSAIADSDGDGIPDWYEVKYRLNAKRNDAQEDADGDGLKNLAEFSRGTHPFDSDTDGDGLSDFVETGSGQYINPARPGTDPLLADTDRDGLSDGDEIQGGLFFSHPLLWDTDLDGNSDLRESQANSNPSSSAVSLHSAPTRDSSGAWTWVIEGLQIVQNHRSGEPTLASQVADRLCAFTVRNPNSEQESNAWRFALDHRSDGLHWRIEAGPGAFSHSIAPFAGFGADHPGGLPATLTPVFGFSGRGPQDISDRLRIKMELLPPAGSQTTWSLRVRCFNLDKSPEIPVSESHLQGIAVSPGVQSGEAFWQSDSTPPRYQEMQVFTRPGVTVFFSRTRLDETSAFGAARDADEDGVPDLWEIESGGDPYDSSDTTADYDGDGLDQMAEFTAGTSPNDSDSDDDGVNDRLELLGFADPLSPSSRPFLSGGLTSAARAGDFDGNGMPDAWEAFYRTNGRAATEDPDGDGLSNAQESLAGTHPFRAASAFRASLRQDGNGTLRLEWPAIASKRYSVGTSAGLNVWQPAPAIIQGPDTSSMMNAALGLQGARRFYRVQVSDRDTDNDGVNDWTEGVLGTDPANPASAGSNLPVDPTGEDGSIAVSGDYVRLASLAGDIQTGADGSGNGPVSPAMAARFLTQASFGPTMEEIEKVRKIGYAAWLDGQINQQPAYYHSTYLREIREDLAGPRLIQGYAVIEEALGTELSPENVHTPFLRAALQQGDQLRQRVAYALSQIFVVSRRDSGLFYQSEGLANFYDILVRNSFGNFRDILLEVTRHPVMGRYLSHIGNQKARPEISQFPDENYAREIMQLFSIGLWELNPDGTRKKDAAGAGIPTYGNPEITEFARVFTGFWFAGQSWGNGGTGSDFTQPMEMHAVRHDFERKRLLRGAVVPARLYSRESALQDVEDAIDNLFQHPNTPPFICRQLIQLLVSSNPSPAYVQRVQNMFVNDGTGQRGNLAAVIRAILTDPEARSSSVLLTSNTSGALREPLLRFTALCRAFHAGADEPNLLWWDYAGFINTVQQKPLYAPSVFNFYRPDYKPPGSLSQQGLSAPAMQITDSSTAITFPNIAWEWARYGVRQLPHYQYAMDTSQEIALAATPEKLLDRLNLLLCQGLMSPATRSAVLAAIERIPADRAATRARVAIWLTMCGPEGAVQR